MDDRALLAAVVADPDDDLPRLAYADWLDEHGHDDRAEFIRGQCELARLHPMDDRHAELRARCGELERLHRDSWLRGAPRGRIWFGDFERGFPKRVAQTTQLLDSDDFSSMKRGLEVFPLHMFRGRLLGAASASVAHSRQSIYPERGQSPLELLARWPLLARFTTLDLGGGEINGGLGDFQPGIAALAESPHAANLTTLRLSGRLLGVEAILALGSSPHLGHLRALDLRFNVPFLDQPDVLLHTDLPDRLEEIDGIDIETAGRWLRRPGCRLRELGISVDSRGASPAGVDASPLIDAPGLAGLRRLALSFDGPAVWQQRMPARGEVVHVERLTELLASPLLSHLEDLNLCGILTFVTQLGEIPMTRNLVTLRLRRFTLTGDCLPFLRRAFFPDGRLRRLDLSQNYLTTADAITIAGWPELARLHELRLNDNDIKKGGFDALRASPHRRPWLALSG